jgi:hypothetical protein
MKLTGYHNPAGVLTVILVCGLLTCACRPNPQKESRPGITPDEEKEMLMRINKFLVRKDIDLIRNYSKRRGWDMEVTEAGLFYQVYDQTGGKKAEEGMRVRLDYALSLLDGTLCYSSEKDGQKVFVLGKSQEISGLEQGVQMMREGEKARFIIPPHLGYGLLGDEKRIPARSIIVYEVELAEIEGP